MMSSRSAFFSTLVFIVAVIVITVSVVAIASAKELRWKIDATKSRAYSLSEQTQSLLQALEDEWTIAVVLVESQADAATVRQIDEVLSRLAATASSLTVRRIDPTDPASIGAYEILLLQLQERYAEEITASEQAIEQGLDAFRGLMRFATAEAGPLRIVAGQSPGATRDELLPRAGALSLLAGQGNLIVDEVLRGLELDEGRPLPDFATAITILIQALSQWAEELEDATRLLSKIATVEASALQKRFSAEAASCALAADRLKRLPDLELSTIARQLQGGEAAIVMGPTGAVVIPANQLFPGAVSGGGDRVSFDRRFRGEQLFASAIRSLRDGQDPTVVFVHGEERSMLDASPQNVDVSGAAAMLEANRVGVREWSVATGTPPLLDPDQPVVWIVLPPARRTGLKPSESEMKLLRVSSDLMAQGEPVLVSLYPSLLPRYGQQDPWAALVQGLGIEARTGLVVAESRRAPDGRDDVQLVQPLTEFTERHPIAAALHGQTLALPLPIPLGWSEPSMEPVTGTLLASVQPSEARWLASDWSPQDAADLRPNQTAALSQASPSVAAIERASPIGDGAQRVLVVGSGGWMLNYVADMVLAAGGDRYALLYPGNHELLLSGTAWLAGLDERIASGPLSQEVARLGSIPTPIRAVWTWVLLLGIPGFVAVIGMMTWLVRRR